MKKILGVALVLGLMVSLAGCSSETKTADAAKTAEPIKMGRVDYAAHGESAVAIGTVAAVQGDKIVGASIDDYQFMSTADGVKGIPNSDKEKFNKNYANPKTVLASKRVNAEYYGGKIKAKGATNDYDKNLDAIEDFATGKTVADLEKILKETPADKMPVDTVSGSTLTDTHGYLSAILEAAKAAK